MYISDKEVQSILMNFVGDPPKRKLVEYHIWVNQEKFDFYSRPGTRFEKGQDLKDSLDSYRRLVDAGKKLLETLPSE